MKIIVGINILLLITLSIKSKFITPPPLFGDPDILFVQLKWKYLEDIGEKFLFLEIYNKTIA